MVLVLGVLGMYEVVVVLVVVVVMVYLVVSVVVLLGRDVLVAEHILLCSADCLYSLYDKC